MPAGLPASRWMAEVGAFVLRSDTELLLKSRRVVSGRLGDAGFEFRWPEWEGAAGDLVRSARSARDAGAVRVVVGCGCTGAGRAVPRAPERASCGSVGLSAQFPAPLGSYLSARLSCGAPDEAPQVVRRAVVRELDHLGAVGRGHAVHAQHLAAVAVADQVPAVAVVDQGPEVVGGAVVLVLGDPCAVRRGHAVHAQDLAAVAVADQVPALPWSISCQAWSPVPVFANCTTRALFSVDMPSTARTLPLCRFSIRRYGGSGVQGRPSGDAVETR